MAAKRLSSWAAVKNICVNHIRDGLVEEFHEGIVQFGVEGDDSTPYYLRSCAKPLQASLLVDYGIDFTSKELAFCSGSHAGEECHVEVAKGILKKLDLELHNLKKLIGNFLGEFEENALNLKKIYIFIFLYISYNNIIIIINQIIIYLFYKF